MAIQYVDAFGDAVCNLPEPYVITSSNNQFSVSINGGSAQVFTLTSGTRTAAQIVTDLSGLTGATASVVGVNNINYVRVTTTTNSGTSSTIQFNTPSNNSNTILGFIATTYTGGQAYSGTFVASVKQDVVSGIEDALNNAGWVTISGHHSSPCIVQSAMSQSPQNLRMRLQMTTAGSNCAIISLENVSGSFIGGNSNGNSGVFLLPGSSTTWQVIANKYQGFAFVPSTNTPRQFGAWGVPYLPSWLQGEIYETMWLAGNAASDGDSTLRGSFRGSLGGTWNGNQANCQFSVNGNHWEIDNNTGGYNIGCLALILPMGSTNISIGQNFAWHDNSGFMWDPILCYSGLTATDEGYARGQLWNAFVSSQAYTVDTTITAMDGHNWQNITSNNTGATTGTSNWSIRGSLFLTTS
jgi:hypothetical protein